MAFGHRSCLRSLTVRLDRVRIPRQLGAQHWKRDRLQLLLGYAAITPALEQEHDRTDHEAAGQQEHQSEEHFREQTHLLVHRVVSRAGTDAAR